MKYTAILGPYAVTLLKSFPMPEPPSDVEMAEDLAGLERLTHALEAMEHES